MEIEMTTIRDKRLREEYESGGAVGGANGTDDEADEVQDSEEEEEVDDDGELAFAGVSDVPAKFLFKDNHRKRLVAQHTWYEYDPTTGISSCAACAACKETVESAKCKLDDGVLIDSKHISGRLNDHAGEKSHQRAMKVWCKMSGAAEPTQDPVEAAVVTAAAAALQEQLKEMCTQRRLLREPLTRAAMYLGSESRPANDMPAVCEMIEKSAAALGATKTMEQTHRDHHTAAALFKEISKQLEERDITEIRASPVQTFGADESVDRGMHENMVVYLGWIHQGEAKFKFFKMLHLVGGANAENIKAALETCLSTADPSYKKKLVGMSADGASVMLGVKSGVSTRMRKDTAWLLVFHCICHRLALGANESAAKVSH